MIIQIVLRVKLDHGKCSVPRVHRRVTGCGRDKTGDWKVMFLIEKRGVTVFTL